MEERHLHLAPSDLAPSEARREFSLIARDWLSDDLADHARLLLSELVTNTIRHAAPESVDVRVVREMNGVLVEVCQEGPVEAVKVVQRQDDEVGGWGLMLVDELSDSWGVQDEPPCVWFRLSP